MSVPEIRPATAADREAILRLLEQASLPTEDLATSAARFWVAEEGGEVIGAIGLEQHGSLGLLRSLAVVPAARRRGIGLELVRRLEREARAAEIAQLALLTQGAKAFFERLGYVAVARDSAPDAVKASAQFRSLCPASATCMRKPLPERERAGAGAGRPVRVLFLCTGNSCRSILAEATFNHLAPAGWRAMSAGSQPAGYVHPRSLALLAREGIATAGCHSKSWDELPQVPDIVITVCASAAGETCPAWLGPALRTHWGVADPAHATGSDAEIDAAFAAAYRTLRRRIEAFLALPLAELQADPARLKAALDRIGAQVA